MGAGVVVAGRVWDYVGLGVESSGPWARGHWRQHGVTEVTSSPLTRSLFLSLSLPSYGRCLASGLTPRRAARSLADISLLNSHHLLR